MTVAADDEVVDDEVVDDEVIDPFEEFNRAMGADGDASPYPGFIDARRLGPILNGAGEFAALDLAISEEGADGSTALGALAADMFTAYSYEAVQAVLGDGVNFSSSGYSEFIGAVMGRSILEMDEPEHREYRGLIQQAFSRRSMERWEEELVGPLVNGMIDEFIDDGSVDLVRELMFPFPVRVIAELLGLPHEDLPEFHRLAVELIGVSVDWDRALAASASLKAYLADIVAERRRRPADDMISLLIAAERDGQRLTDEDIFAFLRLLLPAGAETTYRSSSNLLYGLLSNTGQLDAVRGDRSLLPQAIEEGIRWEPPLLIVVRTAVGDVDVCGVRIPAGSVVITNMGSANHDDTRWDRPEEFDIFRERKPHIGFAHGPHMCLGMHLARMETTVVLESLLDRLPNLRLDPAAGPAFISGMTFRAPPALDVLWG